MCCCGTFIIPDFSDMLNLFLLIYCRLPQLLERNHISRYSTVGIKPQGLQTVSIESANCYENADRLRTNYKIIKLEGAVPLPFTMDEIPYTYDGITNNEVLKGIGVK